MAKKKNIVTLKNMLKSDSAKGKPLSAKQKKYFADLLSKQLGTYQDGGSTKLGPEEWLKNYINSPEYAARMKHTSEYYLGMNDKNTKEDYTSTTQIRRDNINKYSPKIYYDYNNNTSDYSAYHAAKNEIGVIAAETNINVNDFSEAWRYAFPKINVFSSDLDNIELHERSHQTRKRLDATANSSMPGKLLESERETIMWGPGGYGRANAMKYPQANLGLYHADKPDEIKSDIDTVRYMLYKQNGFDITKGEQVTPEMLQNLLELHPTDFLLKRLNNAYHGDLKRLSDLMNFIAAEPGKKQFIQTARTGGPIVDPKGQWAHPGQNTIIPSNNITMRGVPYEVLGISDTNDMKIMKPGKNYKFKGKKVLEIPLMQDGGSIVGKQIAPASTGVSIPEYFVRQGMFKRPEEFLVLPQDQKLLLVDQYMRDERGAMPIADSSATQMYKPGKLNQDYVADVVGIKTKLRDGGPVEIENLQGYYQDGGGIGKEVLKALAPAALGLIPGAGPILAPMASAAINAVDAPKPVMPAAPKEEIRNTTNPFTGMSYKFGGELGNRANYLKSVSKNALKETSDPRFFLAAGESHEGPNGGNEAVVSGGARLKYEKGELYNDEAKAFINKDVAKPYMPMFKSDRKDNISTRTKDLAWKEMVMKNNELNMKKGNGNRMIMAGGGPLDIPSDQMTDSTAIIPTDTTTSNASINQFPWGALVNVPGMLADFGTAAGGAEVQKEYSLDPAKRLIEGLQPSYAAFDQAKNDLKTGLNTALYNIDANTSGGAANANKQNVYSKYLGSLTDLAVNKATQMYSDKLTKATALAGMEGQEIQQKYAIDNINDANRAAVRNKFGEGMAKIGEGIAGFAEQRNADKTNALTLSLAQQIATNYGFDIEKVYKLLQSGVPQEDIIKYLG